MGGSNKLAHALPMRKSWNIKNLRSVIAQESFSAYLPLFAGATKTVKTKRHKTKLRPKKQTIPVKDLAVDFLMLASISVGLVGGQDIKICITCLNKA